MAKRDLNRKGRYSPTCRKTRQDNLRGILEEIDRETRPRRPQEKGLRAKFLAKYRQEGYDAAEAMIYSTPTGRKAFPKEILKSWIEEEQSQ